MFKDSDVQHISSLQRNLSGDTDVSCLISWHTLVERAASNRAGTWCGTLLRQRPSLIRVLSIAGGGSSRV